MLWIEVLTPGDLFGGRVVRAGLTSWGVYATVAFAFITPAGLAGP